MRDLSEFDYLWDGSEPGWVLWAAEIVTDYDPSQTQRLNPVTGRPVKVSSVRYFIYNEITGQALSLPDDAEQATLEAYLVQRHMIVRDGIGTGGEYLSPASASVMLSAPEDDAEPADLYNADGTEESQELVDEPAPHAANLPFPDADESSPAPVKKRFGKKVHTVVKYMPVTSPATPNAPESVADVPSPPKRIAPEPPPVPDILFIPSGVVGDPSQVVGPDLFLAEELAAIREGQPASKPPPSTLQREYDATQPDALAYPNDGEPPTDDRAPGEPPAPQSQRLYSRKADAVALAIVAVCVLLWFALNGRPGTPHETPWNIYFGGTGDTRADVSATDANGNVFAAGMTTGQFASPNAGGDDIWISRYDPNGHLQWTKQFGSPVDEMVTAMVVDHHGNAIVVGGTEGDLFGKNHGAEEDGLPQHDAFVVKIDPSGNIVWQHQFGKKGDDIAETVAVSKHDTVYVAGETNGTLFGINAGSDTASDPTGGTADIFIVKFDSNGHKEWMVQHGAPGDDNVDSLALDDIGDCYISGATYNWLQPGDGSRKGYIAKLDPTGQLIWSAEANVQPNSFPSGVVLGFGNNVYLTNDYVWDSITPHHNPGVEHFDTDGRLLQSTECALPAGLTVSTAKATTDGGLVVCGSAQGATYGKPHAGDDGFVSRYAPTGAMDWGQQYTWPSAATYTGNGLLTNVFIDPKGIIYATGETECASTETHGDRGVLMKLDNNGNASQ